MTTVHLLDPPAIQAWLGVASQPSVLRRALGSCVVVGVILTVVNHGPQLVAGELSLGLVVQIALTLLVPFLVSLISSVAAIRGKTPAAATDPMDRLA